MSKIKNTRFPHTCRISRVVNEQPMIDDPDEEYDPMIDDDPMSDDPMGDDFGDDSGNGTDNGNDEESPSLVTVYDGICRVEPKHTTNDTGKVITSTRRISIPMTLDDWDKSGNIPMVGDSVKIYKGSFLTESGGVIDVQPGSLGTTVLFTYNA